MVTTRTNHYRMLRVLVLAGVLGLWSSDLAQAQRRITVKTPHRGQVVRVLPRGHANVTVRGVRYHVHAVGGTFYRPHTRGFVVVTPPLGASVRVLPRGAVRVTRGGMAYYRHNDVHYRPVTARGVTAFIVARF